MYSSKFLFFCIVGFDLIEVGEHEVNVGIGKHVTMRMLQLALQAALALFGKKFIFIICRILKFPKLMFHNLSTETHEVHDSQGGSFERSISLESLELGTEELCDIPNVQTAMQGPAYLPARQPIVMGKGAFTSYVRSRGEPDGHTNISSTDIKQRSLRELKLPKIPSGNSRPPIPALRNPTNSSTAANRAYKNIAVERTDSSTSSGSSMADWENGLTTVRRRAPPIPENHPDSFFMGGMMANNSVSQFDSSTGSDNQTMMPAMPPVRKPGRFIQHNAKSTPSNNSASTAGKRVTWKMNEIAAANANKALQSTSTEAKPWLASRSTFSIQKDKEQPPTTQQTSTITNFPEHHTKSTPLVDVYQERNVGLGLAPSLSKLLLSNWGSLGPVENLSGNKSDTDARNMSAAEDSFDQLSLADDSAAEGNPPNSTSSSTPGRKGITSKRMLKGGGGAGGGRTHPKNGSGPFVTTAEISPISLNLAELSHDNNNMMSGSSTSSSKSSPSDFSKERDEGDGRSLTDSQYGSYSPSTEGRFYLFNA